MIVEPSDIDVPVSTSSTGSFTISPKLISLQASEGRRGGGAVRRNAVAERLSEIAPAAFRVGVLFVAEHTLELRASGDRRGGGARAH